MYALNSVNVPVSPAPLDLALLGAAQAGDPAALQCLLQPYESRLLRLCRGILAGREDAEDAVQETFLRVIRGLPKFRRDANLDTWIYRIAVNLCLDWKRPGSRALPLEAAAELRSPAASPEGAVLTQSQIERALCTLTPRRRAVFLLREWWGWSAREISELLRCPERRVHNDLYAARRTLEVWAAREL